MKLNITSFLFCCSLVWIGLSVAQPVQAQDRTVAVVYDNSGSMGKNGQCDGINYALQVMVGLLHPDDELYVYKMFPPNGDRIDLNQKRGSIGTIQTTYDCEAKSTPFDAAINAKAQLAQSRKKNKWMVILSDGEITDKTFIQRYQNELKDFIEKTGGRVIFLNVNNKESALDKYFDMSNTPETTLRTGGSFEQVIGRMEEIASNIMTLSGSGVTVTPKGNDVVFEAPLPLKRIIVLEQSTNINADLPKVIGAKAQGKSIFISNAYEAQKSAGTYRMFGIITHIQGDRTGKAIIPKGTVELSFNKAVDSKRIKILPEAAARLEVDLRGHVKSRQNNVFTICDSAKTATVVARLVDYEGNLLDPAVLGSSRVKFINEDTKEEKVMMLDKATGEFVTEISTVQERIPVSVAASYEGFFNYQSTIFIIDKAYCPIPEAFIKAPKTTLKALVTDMDNAESITVIPQIVVGDAAPRNPTPEEMKSLYIEQIDESRIGIDVTEDNGKLIIRPAAFLCACFTKTGRGELILSLKSKDPSIVIREGSGNMVINVEIEDDTFWAKCGTLIITTILLLILGWYILGLLRKPRFCRGSEVIYGKETKHLKRKPKSFPLPTGFFNRYLVPYIPEKQSVGSVTFKAGSRCSHILIPEEAQNENMFISGFPVDNPGVKDLRLSNGEKMEIQRRNGKEIYEYRKLT